MNIDQRIEKKYKKTECVKMKQHCDTDTDNILMEDWCDIEPKNYVRKGTVNPQQCFALHHLITWMETGLNTTGEIKDPTTNVVMDNETVIQLCGRHVHNGNDLPDVLGAHVMALIPPEDEDDDEWIQRVERISLILNNSFEIEEDEVEEFRILAKNLAHVNPQTARRGIIKILRDHLKADIVDINMTDIEPLISQIIDELY